MRAHFDILSFAVLGLLSVAQADPRHYNYEAPARRGIIGDILGKLNGEGNAKTTSVKTVTETLRQTVTLGAAALGGKNGTAATKTVTVTAAGAAGAAQVAGTGVQLSFVTTTVFGTGNAPTQTVTALASTVTQMMTMTMVQMIACGSTLGTPVLPAEASTIANAAASKASTIANAAASKETTVASASSSSSSLAALTSSATTTTAAAQAVNPAIPAASTTSTVAGPAAVGIPDGAVRGIGFLDSAGACACQVACMNPSFSQAVGIAPAGLAPFPVVSTSSTPLAAATSITLAITGAAGAAAAVTPAAVVATMNPADLQGVNVGPSIDLSNVSLTNVINLGALIQTAKAA